VWFFDFANNHQFQLFKTLELVFFAEYLESQIHLQVQFLENFQNGKKLQIWVFEKSQRIDDFHERIDGFLKRDNHPTLVFIMLLL
jgi:hypothetical protein